MNRSNKNLTITLAISLLVLALVMAAAVSLQPQPALAGFGNTTSHSSHSSSSHSSSSFHSSPSSGGFNRPFGGSTSGGSGGSGPLGWIMALVFGIPAIIVIVIVFLVVNALRKQKLGNILDAAVGYDDDENTSPGLATTGDNNLAQLKQNDPNFSEINFISRVNNMYLQLQDSWMKKHWSTVRPFETDELFNMHNKQLQAFIDNHTTNMMEEICVLETRINHYEDDGVNDILSVLLKARLKDYVIDDNTRKVVEGDPHLEIYMTYMLKMIRKKGVLTNPDKESVKVTQCPNCGANVSINASGQCDYCGSAITSGQYDWVLAAVNVLDQS